MTDFDAMSLEELQALIRAAGKAFAAREQALEQAERDRREQIRDSADVLDTIRGDSTEPCLDCVSGLAVADPSMLEQHAGVALKIIATAVDKSLAVTAEMARSH